MEVAVVGLQWARLDSEEEEEARQGVGTLQKHNNMSQTVSILSVLAYGQRSLPEHLPKECFLHEVETCFVQSTQQEAAGSPRPRYEYTPTLTRMVRVDLKTQDPKSLQWLCSVPNVVQCRGLCFHTLSRP